MKTKKEILEAISQITFEMETHYPELYRFMDEAPETIPSQEHPNMDAEVWRNYWEGLKRMLKEYKKTHATN